MSFSIRTHNAGLAAILAGLIAMPPIQAAEPLPDRLTLQQAIDSAFAKNPGLRARKAEVEQAEGRLFTAETYPFNPEVTVGATRRSNGDSTTDREFRVGQEIEIGGQGRQREAVATAELDAFRARLVREERLLAARVRAAFVEALRARDLHEVEANNADLARSLGEVSRKRFESGASAQMEVNLAQIQVGRAERSLTFAQAAYDVARSVLAQVVGLDPAQPPELDGELALPAQQPPLLPDLLASATLHRADLLALRSESEAARVRIELARRERVPNLGVEAFYGREDETDRLFGGALTIRIPVFNRNQGRIAESLAAQRQAEEETAASEIQIRQEVAESYVRFRAASQASLGLERQVLGTLEDNLRLLQRSFEAGKTNSTEVLIFRREFVEAQRDYIETVTDALLAGIELELAAGVGSHVTDKESQP